MPLPLRGPFYEIIFTYIVHIYFNNCLFCSAYPRLFMFLIIASADFLGCRQLR